MYSKKNMLLKSNKPTQIDMTPLNRNRGLTYGPDRTLKITECLGLEGIFRGHLAQPPCSEQGHLQLDQAAQSPVQPSLEWFQGCGLHYLSGQKWFSNHLRGLCSPLQKYLTYSWCASSFATSEKIYPFMHFSISS